MADPNERNDVSLCFQALGIEFGAPPEDVEKAYQKVITEIKKKANSHDPAVRTEAMNDLDLINDLYEKIRSSVTYSSRLKEAENAAAIKASIKKTVAAEPQFKTCPSCSKTIGVHFKKCPFCKELILTPAERIFHTIFSIKALVAVILLAALIGGTLFFLKPDIFEKSQPVKSPAADVGTPADQPPAGFANISGAAQKP